MYYQSPSSESNRKDHYSPKNSEWGLLNQQRAIQYQRAKSMQKLLQNEKKHNFKTQLDNQLKSKNNVNQAQKQADRRYYEFITMQAEQMKRNQQRMKMQKQMRRRMAEQYNMKVIQQHRNNNLKNQEGITFSIGLKSQQLKKERQQKLKKVVLDQLDHQVQLKQLQKRQNRQKQIQQFHKNQAYLNQQERIRNINAKKYKQNQDVYNYYSHLNKQKEFLQKQAQYKIVNEAAMKKLMQEDQKNFAIQRKKFEQSILMKNVLAQQLHQKQRKKREQNQVNPEDINYKMFSSIFQDKYKHFDKKEYQNYLKNQIQAQKRNKQSQQFMTEQEYKLNSNQLNKAVNGQYIHQSYFDNSLTSIGQRSNKYVQRQVNHQEETQQKSRIIQNDNAQLVRQKLDDLLQKRNDKSSIKQDKFF